MQGSKVIYIQNYEALKFEFPLENTVTARSVPTNNIQSSWKYISCGANKMLQSPMTHAMGLRTKQLQLPAKF